MSYRYVLWGFNREAKVVVPIRIHEGTLRQCRGEVSMRKREGWTVAIYRVGDEPVGLRLQAAESAEAADS